MEGFYNYINNLPKPLDKEEQQKLLVEFYETYDEDIREKLLAHNLQLAADCVMKYADQGYDLEDLMQEATIELAHVLDNKFNIRRGLNFSTFAYACIKMKLKRFVKDELRDSEILVDSDNKTNSLIEENDGEDVDLFETLSSGENFVEKYAGEDRIKRFLATLTPEYRYILLHRTGIFNFPMMSAEEIGEKLGKDKAYVSHIEDNLYSGLRLYYANEGKLPQDLTPNEIYEYIESFGFWRSRDLEVLKRVFGIGRSKMSYDAIATALKMPLKSVIGRLNNVLATCGYVPDIRTLTKKDMEAYILTTSDLLEYQIAEYYYGLNDKSKLSKNDIAKALDVPKSLVYRTLEKLPNQMAKCKLREKVYGVKETFSIDDLYDFYDSSQNSSQKEFIRHAYGLNGERMKSIPELSEMFGISEGAAIYRKLKISKSILKSQTFIRGLVK